MFDRKDPYLVTMISINRHFGNKFQQEILIWKKNNDLFYFQRMRRRNTSLSLPSLETCISMMTKRHPYTHYSSQVEASSWSQSQAHRITRRKQLILWFHGFQMIPGDSVTWNQLFPPCRIQYIKQKLLNRRCHSPNLHVR